MVQISDLPPEVILQIFDNCCRPPATASRFPRRPSGPSDLLLFSLVCSAWYPLAQQLLWKKVHLNSRIALDRMLASDTLGRWRTEELSLTFPKTAAGRGQEEVEISELLKSRLFGIKRLLVNKGRLDGSSLWAPCFDGEYLSKSIHRSWF